ncbi:MAG: hypothetical protein K0R41_3647 [Geminicoccaceae bacterium]|jgi:hypothetical protein|nr:hypothetical protein [Geminicoccaceae bacterium]MDF2782580.1 hypothetical protein [Geminicoccaceae bacterium]
MRAEVKRRPAHHIAQVDRRQLPIVLLNHPGITVAEHLHGNDYDSRAVRADARQPDIRLEVFPAV